MESPPELPLPAAITPEGGDNAPVVPAPPEAPAPWGAWASVGWSVAIYVFASFVAGSIASVATLIGYFDGADMLEPAARSESPSRYGAVLSIISVLTAAVAAPLIYLTARVRSAKGETARYLGLVSTPLRPAIAYIAATQLAIIAWGGLLSLFGDPQAETFIEMVMRTTPSSLLLVLGIVIAPAVFEELLFRGLLLRGLMASRLGATGGVIASSILFTVVHVQYDFLNLTIVFALALSLAVVRIKTNSLWPPIALHALNNGIAVAVTAWS